MAVKGTFKDITGQRFGRLIAMTIVDGESSASGERYWLCQCDCGNTANVHLGNLRSGNTKSCGCLNDEMRRMRYRDLAGQKFGRLVAIELTGDRNNQGSLMWLCRCECGNDKAISSWDLRSGGTISCGCAKYCWPPVRNAKLRARKAHNQNVRWARSKNAEGSYTAEEVEALYVKQKGRCAWCGKPIETGEFHRDHIMPLSRGGDNYITNIQLLCPPCNWRKQGQHPEVFAQKERANATG